MNSISDSYM